MRAKVCCVNLLAIAALVSGHDWTHEARADSPSTVLGHIAPSHGSPHEDRQVILLYGKRVSMPIEVTFKNGQSFINGEQWLPAPADLATRESSTVEGTTTTLTDELMRPFAHMAYVRGLIASGIDSSDAVQTFMNAIDYACRTADSTYQANSNRGRDSAYAAACATIDGNLAENNPQSPNAPRLSPGGGIMLFIHDIGWRGTIVSQTGGIPPRSRSTNTVDTARMEYIQLARLIALGRPLMVVYSRGAHIILTGDDATAAISEHDEVERHARDNTGTPSTIQSHSNARLPAAVREEIVSYVQSTRR